LILHQRCPAFSPPHQAAHLVASTLGSGSILRAFRAVEGIKDRAQTLGVQARNQAPPLVIEIRPVSSETTTQIASLTSLMPSAARCRVPSFGVVRVRAEDTAALTPPSDPSEPSITQLRRAAPFVGRYGQQHLRANFAVEQYSVRLNSSRLLFALKHDQRAMPPLGKPL